jgi:ribosomal protein S18 acetylase RimI-like enzyme
MGSELRMITIRPFETSDRDRVLDIAVAAWQPVFKSYREILGGELFDTMHAGWEEDKRSQVRSACEGKHGALVQVGVLSGQVAGFVTYYSNGRTKVGEIGNNAVHPDFQKKGVATALYEAVLSDLKASGMEHVEVHTGGDPSHAPARAAYEKVGFNIEIPSVTYYRQL